MYHVCKFARKEKACRVANRRGKFKFASSSGLDSRIPCNPLCVLEEGCHQFIIQTMLPHETRLRDRGGPRGGTELHALPGIAMII